MANKKISSLGSLGGTPNASDIIPITDVSDTTGSAQGTTKKVTVANLVAASPVQSVAGRTGTVTLSNADISGLGTAAVADTGTSNGNVVVLDSTGLPAIDGSQLTNLPAGDVSGAVNDNLRGTDNPHIGAFPNQAFKVVDNPFNSAFLAAREDGEISVITSTGAEVLSKGFSIVEDSTEPDIEAIGTLNGVTENYSVISGDSDTVGANGLPIRQGFNNPDIGSNSSPILISGGSIA